MGTARQDVVAAKAVVRERRPGKGLGKAPLEEGMVHIGLSGSWKGPTCVYAEIREGGNRPSIIFGRESLLIEGRFVRVFGKGGRKDECGQAGSIVTIHNYEKKETEQEIELLQCEEALVEIGGAKCRIVVLNSEDRETDPNADTNPRFEIPRELSKEDEALIVLDNLQRGETLKMAGGHVLKFIGGGPRNRFLEIRNSEGKCEAEFNGEDGAKFEMRLAGIEEVLVLRLVKETCAQNAVDVFIYPKKWENKEK